MQFLRPLLLLFVSAASVGVSVCEDPPWNATISYRGTRATMHTDAVRCLASSVYSFSKEYGVVIRYEDVPLYHRSDIVDMTSPSYLATGRTDRIFIPRGGSLDGTFDVTIERKPVNMLAAVQALLDAYARAGYPGSYKIANGDGIIEVLPFQTLALDGHNIKVT
jgi:hypothetical protein